MSGHFQALQAGDTPLLNSNTPDAIGLEIAMKSQQRSLDDTRLGVIGLGYVGLPLAVEFGRKLPTIGFDINQSRVDALRRAEDSTLEVSPEELGSARKLRYSCELDDLRGCNTFIVTVPTPIDEYKRPDLRPLEAASRTVGKVVKRGDVVIYESTVYPGCTEEVCVPIIERESGLTYNVDFFAGYSPERINPGDKQHRLPTIVKVVSGSNEATAEYVDALYRSIVTAGTHRASSIAVAEAAKVIENTQRDVNIALINELALLFERMGLDTEEVLAAAGTKWNFLPFKPGLVGGHCIGVDPYYLTYKAQQIGFHPEMILAGRRINDMMGHHVASRVVKLMTRKRLQVVRSNILILGLAFKENCPDLRNTRVVDLVQEFRSYDANVDVHDPWVGHDEAKHEYGLELVREPRTGAYDAIVLAVAHRDFVALGAEAIRRFGKPGAVLFDVKNCLPKAAVDGRL